MPPTPPHPRRRAWVEVDTGAIGRNLARVRRHVGPGVKIIAMVKCGGYGLGVANVVAALAPGRPFGYGVATVHEGIELRDLGVREPVMICCPVPPSDLPRAIAAHLIPTISDLPALTALTRLAAAAPPTAPPLPFQIEIDTGMGRAGFPLAGPTTAASHTSPPDAAATPPGFPLPRTATGPAPTPTPAPTPDTTPDTARHPRHHPAPASPSPPPAPGGPTSAAPPPATSTSSASSPTSTRPTNPTSPAPAARSGASTTSSAPPTASNPAPSSTAPTAPAPCASRRGPPTRSAPASTSTAGPPAPARSRPKPPSPSGRGSSWCATCPPAPPPDTAPPTGRTGPKGGPPRASGTATGCRERWATGGGGSRAGAGSRFWDGSPWTRRW